MTEFFDFLASDWHLGWDFRWRDGLDVAFMAFFVYQAYVRFRGTRAARIGAGLAVLGLFYFLANQAGLFLTTWVLGGIWAAAFILVVVVFQAEIRQILEHVNPRLPVPNFFRRTASTLKAADFLVTVADTCFALAKKKCGGLLILERKDPLESLLRSRGVLVDAQVSALLLENLFIPTSPLHDGAVYIRDGRVCRAGCVLPLSETRSLPYIYGTRHRAALGITERSDALAVVISEERGAVSVVEHGGMVTLPGSSELLEWLNSHLSGAEGEHDAQSRWRETVFSNLRAKAAALATVCVLWLVLVGPQNTEIGFTIPVIYYNIPGNLDMTGKNTQEVYLRLRGSGELLTLLDPRRLRAQVDLSSASAGRSRYPLTAQDVNVPLGLQVAGLDPASVSVRLKKRPEPEEASEPEKIPDQTNGVQRSS